MSLTSTYVQSQDGKWYKNPVIRQDDWFICWDDNDPMELVIKHPGSPLWNVLEGLQADKWTLKVVCLGRKGMRYFSPGLTLSHAARSYFMRQIDNGPPDTLLSDEYIADGKPLGDCVLYYNSPNGWNERPKLPRRLQNLHSE